MRRFFCGDAFELAAPANDKNVSLLRYGRIIEVKDKCNGFITDCTITRDESGAEMIKANGCSFDGLLSRRILCNGSAADTFMTILSKNCGSGLPLYSYRQFPCTVFDTATDASGHFTDEVKFLQLSEYAKIVGEYEIFGLSSEIMHPAVGLDYIKISGRYGADRSVNQSDNAPVVFADVYDNLLTCEYNYGSAGAYTDAICYSRANFNGNNSPEVIIEERMTYPEDAPGRVPVAGAGYIYAGFDSIEQAIEIEPVLDTTIAISGLSGTITSVIDEDGTAAVASRAAKAAVTLPTDSFVAEVRIESNYRERFDVGDVVTIHNRRWGVTADKRIYEITEFYGTDRTTIECTFGTPQKTLSDYIKGGI